MANEEQLAILKQGVDVWNRWREDNPEEETDLSEVNLFKFKLANANLNRTNFNKAELIGADLSNAELFEANLWGVDLSQANLKEANLNNAQLNGSNLSDANLSNADLGSTNLSGADLYGANLADANLKSAYLWGTNFDKSDLSRANLSHAKFRNTNLSRTKLKNTIFYESNFDMVILGNNDLSCCIHLERIIHSGPSTMGTDTIQKSQGKIPDVFLRGCGLSDWEIASTKLYRPNLSNEEINMILYEIHDLRATRPIQISPLFISYSHSNSNFVDRIEVKLNKNGIRFWRDIHDATAGRLETQIDRAIRHNPTVLLILSEHSTSSDWVEHEARLARKLEKELGRDVLCPIALDDSWKTCNWPERIKEQIMEYNILDFSNWEDDDELDAMFKRLIDGLDMFYKK